MKKDEPKFIQTIIDHLTKLANDPNLELLDGECEIVNNTTTIHSNGVGREYPNGRNTLRFIITYKEGKQ